ncbi:MAG: oligosaccharide flippase family protein [Candidatus Daviesbacteria bacterium]|nr:oligosaccharide flippase family protein [Candidatus Daviesbacteria bacterium]
MADFGDEVTIEVIKKRAIKGVAILAGRTFLLQIISFFAVFLLTVFLEPTQLGTFFLVSAVINFFAYFSDIGLAAALIQKRDALTKEELRTTFTIQQTLVLGLIIIILAITPLLKSWYNLSQDSVYLLWALAFSLLLSSLKSIPSVLLERELRFEKLVIPQIVETLIFYTTVVYMAWQGFGIMSFTAAVLLRGFSGLVIIYLIRPWQIGLAWSVSATRDLLRFGLPYQLNSFLAVFKDDGLIALLGGIIGTQGIGFLGWAQKWAQSPLRFFMDPVTRVTFPAFSRMQHDREELSKALSRSIFFICLLTFPFLVGLVILAPKLIEIIPKYEKWQPALFALVFISFNSLWASVATPITNFFNATGRISITFKLMIMWTTISWLLIPILSFVYGVNGAGIGYAIVGLTSIVALVIASKVIKIDFWGSVIKPLAAALLMGLFVNIGANFLPLAFFSVIISVILGVSIYIIILYLLIGQKIISDISLILKVFKR